MPRKGKEEIMKDEPKEVIVDEVKPEIYEKPEVKETPVLIRPEEFLQLISREYPVESMGGFIFWLKRQGMPPKWPLKMWRAKLEQYLNRKL